MRIEVRCPTQIGRLTQQSLAIFNLLFVFSPHCQVVCVCGWLFMRISAFALQLESLLCLPKFLKVLSNNSGFSSFANHARDSDRDCYKNDENSRWDDDNHCQVLIASIARINWNWFLWLIRINWSHRSCRHHYWINRCWRRNWHRWALLHGQSILIERAEKYLVCI